MWISRSRYERLKRDNEIFIERINELTVAPSYVVHYIEGNDVRIKTTTGFMDCCGMWVTFTNNNEEVAKFKTDLVIRIEKV
jgi:hypothetical protein